MPPLGRPGEATSASTHPSTGCALPRAWPAAPVETCSAAASNAQDASAPTNVGGRRCLGEST
eukprot:7595144-Alexandrium_andersonii.AAC.1